MSDTLGYAQRLDEVASMLRSMDDADSAIDAQNGADELRRLYLLLNTPHSAEFLEAVHLEAMHQRERWAAEHDAGKTDADWFWLVGYLAGKALNSSKVVEDDDPQVTLNYREKQRDKAVHHIITTAAALLNWHAARTGADTRMRPGIAAPSTGDSDV